MRSAVEFHQQDCVEGMRSLLADGSIDVVITSPPYNLGVSYGVHDDGGGRDDYLATCDVWLAEVSRVLAPSGSFFLNVAGKPLDPWVPFEVLQVARRHFVLQNVFHWIKSIAVLRGEAGRAARLDRDVAVGHYKPINSPRFVNDCHEYIFHLTHRGDVPLERLAVGVPYRDKSNIARWKGAAGDLRCRGNTWFLPYDTIVSRARERPHPASFPVALPRRCLQIHGVGRIGRVLDPYTGIGSTAVACVELGLPFIGFDIDGAYLQEARKRVARASGVLFPPDAPDGSAPNE